MTPSQLKAILPQCRDTLYWSSLLLKAEPYGVNTPVRWAAFIAQVGHESAQLNTLTENLSYSIRALMTTWPKRFPDETTAQKYARNPQRTANAVYANRLGNGSFESGDGYKYRGRGLIQVTGKGNYEAMGKGLGLDLVNRPALLELPDNAVRSAGYYWQTNGLNELADENTERSFKLITHKINGGYNGWDDRLALWVRAKTTLGVA